MAVTYTPDADFDELTDRDPTTELIGFVEQVIAPIKVGTKGKQYDLFKFVLSNGNNRKILCLIWNMDLIEKYTSNITVHRMSFFSFFSINNPILHIDGAYTKFGIMNNEKTMLNVIPIEIIIQKSTVVEYLGVHVLQPAIPASSPTDVNFENLSSASGLIRIRGYVKTKFALSDSRYQTMSYGCGSITDGQFKVTIQIANYTSLDIEKGIYVTVIGDVMNNDGLLKINCRDSSCIVPDVEHAVMTAENLLRGTRTLKRRANNQD